MKDSIRQKLRLLLTHTDVADALEHSEDSYKIRVQRPNITPLCLCALIFWACCAAVFWQGRSLSIDTLKILCIVAFLGTITSILVCLAAKRASIVFLIVASVCLGGSLGGAQSYVLLVRSESFDTQTVIEGRLQLLQDSSSGTFFESAEALLQYDDGTSIVVQAQFGKDSVPEQGFLYGSTFAARGKLKQIDFASNTYAWQNANAASFQVESYELVQSSPLFHTLITLRSAAIDSLAGSDTSSSLLQAIACGYRRNLKDSALYGSYQSCGLAHMVAVSGAHLVIVTSLFAGMFQHLKMPRRLVICLLILIMLSYLVLSGAPISALRAIIMSSVGILSLLGKRRPSSQNALGISIFVLLACNPSSSISLSFALSALSTLGIVLFSSLFSQWIQKVPLLRMSVISDTLALTFAASLFSIGLSCSMFSLLPVVSPLSNCATAPLFPFVCALGLLAGVSSALGIPGSGFITEVARLAAHFMNFIVEKLAAFPFAAIPFSCDTVVALIVSFVLASVLWMTWGQGIRILAFGGLLAGILVVAWMNPLHSDRIVMLDVGQGDAFLVESQGSTLLIDTGNQDTRLLEAFAQAKTYSLDVVALTHPDDDHIGSLDALRKGMQIETFAIYEGLARAHDTKSLQLMTTLNGFEKPICGLNAGDSFQVGAFSLTVLWPLTYGEGDNSDSLCLWAEYDGNADGIVDFTALFTGDAESEQLQKILELYGIEHVDILKIGHHGSRKALTTEQVQALKPQIALISVGEQNRYGHPAESILEMLEDTATLTYRTDRDGQVEICLTAEKLVVQ